MCVNIYNKIKSTVTLHANPTIILHANPTIISRITRKGQELAFSIFLTVSILILCLCLVLGANEHYTQKSKKK